MCARTFSAHGTSLPCAPVPYVHFSARCKSTVRHLHVNTFGARGASGFPKSMLPEATAAGKELSGYALARRMDATVCAACCCLCVLIKRVSLLVAFLALGAACGFLLRALGAAASPWRRLRALCGGRSTRRRFPRRLPRRFPPPFSTSTAVLRCFWFLWCVRFTSDLYACSHCVLGHLTMPRIRTSLARVDASPRWIHGMAP